jgi:hypothetical protein
MEHNFKAQELQPELACNEESIHSGACLDTLILPASPPTYTGQYAYSAFVYSTTSYPYSLPRPPTILYPYTRTEYHPIQLLPTCPSFKSLQSIPASATTRDKGSTRVTKAVEITVKSHTKARSRCTSQRRAKRYKKWEAEKENLTLNL